MLLVCAPGVQSCNAVLPEGWNERGGAGKETWGWAQRKWMITSPSSGQQVHAGSSRWTFLAAAATGGRPKGQIEEGHDGEEGSYLHVQYKV